MPGCPIGFYRDAPVVFGCGPQHGHTYLLLETPTASLNLPAGVTDFKLEVQGPGGACLAVLDPATGRELANSSAGPGHAAWQGVWVHAAGLGASAAVGSDRDAGARVAFRGVLPAPLALVLQRSPGPAGAGLLRSMRLAYTSAKPSRCPTVPLGCSPFSRSEAQAVVLHWSRWVRAKYRTATAAWQQLCAPLSQEAELSGTVPYGLWAAVWAKWPGAAVSLPGWQAAFKFVDQGAGQPEDGHVDLEDFGAAFRLADVAAEVLTWCSMLRSAHASSVTAWAAVGGASYAHAGITYRDWESRVWEGQGHTLEGSFAYVDEDGDNVISWNEFDQLYQSCDSLGRLGDTNVEPAVANTARISSAQMQPDATVASGGFCQPARLAEPSSRQGSTFNDVFLQTWSLFLLDSFKFKDTSMWVPSAPSISWSGGKVEFPGGGKSIRSTKALYRTAGAITVKVKLTKVGRCDNHFVMLGTSAAQPWSWHPSPSAVKFAWNCDSKYIFSRNSSASTVCASSGQYVLRIALDPAGTIEFQDDGGCHGLVLQDNLGANGQPLYLYLGTDGPPGASSAFNEVSVSIGVGNAPDRGPLLGATSCLYHGAQYEGPPSGDGRLVEPNVTECQRRCASTPGCARFSFASTNQSCKLFDSSATWHHARGLVSGPPLCIVGVQIQIMGLDATLLTPMTRTTLARRLALDFASAAGLPTGAVKDSTGASGRLSLAEDSDIFACGFVDMPPGRSLAQISSHVSGAALRDQVLSTLAIPSGGAALRGGGGGGLQQQQQARQQWLRPQRQQGQQQLLRVRVSVSALPVAQCFLMDTAYAPNLAEEARASNRAEDAMACQARCARMPHCVRFTFRRPGRECHLHGVSASPSWSAGAITGPRVCDVPPSNIEAPGTDGSGAGALGVSAGEATGSLSGDGRQWWRLGGALILLGAAAAVAMLLHVPTSWKEAAIRDFGVPPSAYRLLSVEEEKEEVVAPAPETLAAPDSDSQAEQVSQVTVEQLPEADQAEEPWEESEQGEPHTQRLAKIYMIFHILDQATRRRLGLCELRHYADLCGFEGTDADWAEEYHAMCEEYGWNAEAGLDIDQFCQLVNDEDGKGYSTNEELDGLLKDCQSAQTP